MRTTNALEFEGIVTIEELVKFSAEQLLRLRNIGVGSLKEIRRLLAKRGKCLAGDKIPEDTPCTVEHS